jgi:hypothetical protein
MQKRFRALRVIGTIFKVLAWIDLILGILGAVGVLIFGVLGGIRLGGALGQREGALQGLAAGGLSGLGTALVILLLTLLYFLILYATGEAIYLALAVEENTREAALLLREMRQRPIAPAEAPAPAAPPPPPTS